MKKYSKEEKEFIGKLKPIPLTPVKEKEEKPPKEEKEKKLKDSDWL